MKNISKLSGLFIIAMYFFGCVHIPTKTDIQIEWNDTSYTKGGPQNILVIILGKDTLHKNAAENIVSRMIAENGIKTVPSYQVLQSDTDEISKETIKPIVEKHGFDAVFIAMLDHKEQKTKVIPGYSYSTSTYGYGHGNSGWGGHGGGSSSFSQTIPTEHINYENIYVDSRLYDAASEKMIWQVMSKTQNNESFHKSLKQLTRKLIDNMKSKGLI
jgi:hypothetical protein